MKQNLQCINSTTARHGHLVYLFEKLDSAISRGRLRDYLNLQGVRPKDKVLIYDTEVKTKLQFMDDNIAF